MKLKATICIDAPKERVWALLSDVENVNLWVKPVVTARCESTQTRGEGTIRVCQLNTGATIREQWIAWDEGHSYTYQVVNIALMKKAINKWSVEDVNGKTLLTSEATIQLKGGLFGRLLEPIVRIWSTRLGARSLSAFKYLVETGHAFEGKVSELPALSVTC